MTTDKELMMLAARADKIHQSIHEKINAFHYPGTRQLCSKCDAPTGRCEEDSIFINELGPLCEVCAENTEKNEE